MKDFLSQVVPFTHLPAKHIEALASASREHVFPKGQTLFRRGEQPDAVWVVKTGKVRLLNYLPSGKASAICVMAPRDLFCCFPAMDGRAYPADAVAVEASTVVRIPLEHFQRLLFSVPEFNREAVCHFCERLRPVEDRGCMLFESAEKRIARILLELTAKYGATLPMTRQEVAEMAGTTLETTIRVLSQWGRDKLVEGSRGRITVKQSEALARIGD